MKRAAVVVAIVAAVLLLIGIGADRAVAAVAERTITQKIEESVTGASSVSTSIVGVPILTQVARGSLDHVTVRVDDLVTPTGPSDLVGRRRAVRRQHDLAPHGGPGRGHGRHHDGGAAEGARRLLDDPP